MWLTVSSVNEVVKGVVVTVKGHLVGSLKSQGRNSHELLVTE